MTARVLVVEDEALVRMLVVDTLEEAGFAVLEAGRPDDALKIIEADGVDAVVCDVGLPGMNGPDMIARARQTRPGLPVLMMTGYAKESVLSEVAAPMEVVSKPFSPDDLAAKVRKLLGG